MKQTTLPGRYFSVLDGIRGIAAILVLMRHTPNLFGVEFPLSFLAVDLFFALSGVVIANAYEERIRNGLGAWRFIWLRWVRIYPLYLLGTVLGIAGVCFGAPYAGNLPVLAGLNLLLLPYFGGSGLYQFNGASWSLFFEIVANALYALFFPFLTNRGLRRIIVYSALGLLAMGFLLFIELDAGWKRDTFVYGFLRVGFSFFLGVFLYRKFAASAATIRRGMPANLIALALFAVSIAVLTASPADDRVLVELLAILVVFPATIYIALALEPTARFARVCKFLGLISYGLYTLHWPVHTLLRFAMGTNMPANGAPLVSPYAPWIGIGFVVGLAGLCVLLDRLYDAPVRRWMLKLFAQPDGRASARLAPLPAVGAEEMKKAS